MKGRFTSLIIMLAALGGNVARMSAQDVFDDIYYNPKTEEQKARKAAEERALVGNYPSADTYTPSMSVKASRDIDEYNRRGIFANGASASQATSVIPDDSIASFACTQRIERFYNPDVVTGSSDPSLAEVYYAESQPSTTINLIVADPGYYWGYAPSPWSWGWTTPAWAWNSWYAPSWSYSWSWGPSWSWGWGYGPSWSWGPGWGWTPGWGPATPPPPHHNGWAGHRPYHNNRHHGAIARPRPGHNPGTGIRPAGNGTRPGAVTSTGRHHGASKGNYNPSDATRHQGGYRPGANSTNRSVSTGVTRHSRQSGTTTTRQQPNVTRHQSTTPSRQSSSGSYRGGNSGGNRPSSGGGRSGGGGGGRGRH